MKFTEEYEMGPSGSYRHIGEGERVGFAISGGCVLLILPDPASPDGLYCFPPEIARYLATELLAHAVFIEKRSRLAETMREVSE